MQGRCWASPTTLQIDMKKNMCMSGSNLVVGSYLSLKSLAWNVQYKMGQGVISQRRLLQVNFSPEKWKDSRATGGVLAQ